jgi:predicted aminopeptidase
MLQGDDLWLAELLFHELVHRRFYLKGDTRFNEGLATAVSREGVRRWLAAQGDPARVAVLLERDQARQAFLALVADTRQELELLYQAGLAPAAMRQAREQIIAELRRRYVEARQTLPELAGYADWFAGPLNNAQLNMVSDYHDQVPLFDAALLRCGGNWRCFWREVEKLARLPAAERALPNRNLHD